MKMLKMIEIAADLVKAGKTNDEISRYLYSLNGSRCAQIAKVMDLLK